MLCQCESHAKPALNVPHPLDAASFMIPAANEAYPILVGMWALLSGH